MKSSLTTLNTARQGRPGISAGMNGKASLCGILLALVCLVVPAQSAITLGLWDFNNTNEVNFLDTAPTPGTYSGTTYINAAAAVPHLTVSKVSAEAGIRSNGSAGVLNSAGTAVAPSYNGVMGVGGSNAFVFPSGAVGAGSATAVMAATDYFTVTLTPASGYTLNLTEISFYGWGNQTNNTGSYTYFVQSSLTGNTILGTTTKAYNAAGALVNNNTSPAATNLYTFDLSGNPNLTGVSGPVTFYVGVYATTNGSLRLDNLQILGEVVPEPSRALLLGMALVGCLLRRRRC